MLYNIVIQIMEILTIKLNKRHGFINILHHNSINRRQSSKINLTDIKW